MRFFLALCLLAALPLHAQEGVPPAGEPSADDDRITFDFELSAAQGGGRVKVWAGDFEYQEEEYVVASGGVRLEYKDLTLQADLARVDIPSNVLTAEGDVVLDEGKSRLIGAVLEYNLTTRTGKITQATAYVDESYTFTGETISKVGPITYTIEQGTFTSCTDEVPDWSIHMSGAKVTLNDYAHLKNARMKLKKVPILYVPRLVWPTKTDRASGFLVPQPGYSTRRGVELGLAYYKTLGRSADTTFFFDGGTEEFYAFGNEVRYRPSQDTKGFFETYILQDPDFTPEAKATLGAGINQDLLPDETRWKLNWIHESNNLWGGFRGVVNLQDYSDPTYRQDFERSLGRQTNNFIYSNAYLTRNFGRQSFNIMVDSRERVRIVNFLDAGRDGRDLRGGRIVETRRQIPEIEYRLRSTQLGGAPIYFSVDANLHYLSLENNNSRLDGNNDPIAEEYGRADLFPSFSFPLSTLPWLSVKVDVGGRVTSYTNTLDPQTNRFREETKALTRTFGFAAAEVVGPSFAKIYEKEKPGGRFSKWKHIIEPRIVYSNLDDFADPDELGFEEEVQVPLFDDLDRPRIRNESTVSIINRILAKPRNEEEGGAFEILSFEIQRPFSFSEDLELGGVIPTTGEVVVGEKKGPLRAILRYNPSQHTSFKAETRYSTLYSGFRSVSISGGAKFGPHTIGGSVFATRNPRLDETTSNQAEFFTSIALIRDKLTFDAAVSMDLESETVSNPLRQRYFLNYQSCCYSLQFEYRESRFGEIEDRDFRFAFTLRNVGTFIDLNGSVD